MLKKDKKYQQDAGHQEGYDNTRKWSGRYYVWLHCSFHAKALRAKQYQQDFEGQAENLDSWDNEEALKVFEQRNVNIKTVI